MVRNNKTCMVCGEHYTYCDRCEEFDHLPKWMNLFECENCREIFNTLTDYNINALPKEEAIKRLRKCDLSKMRNKEFNSCIAKQVNTLLSSETQNNANKVVQTTDVQHKHVEQNK